MKNNFKIISLPLIVLFIYSCSYNSEDDLIIANEEIPVVTYTENIKNIIDNNCVSCHGGLSPVAGLSLTNFNEVRLSVLNNGLINRIMLPSGNPKLMPVTGRMPQQTIDLVIKWQIDGLLD